MPGRCNKPTVVTGLQRFWCCHAHCSHSDAATYTVVMAGLVHHCHHRAAAKRRDPVIQLLEERWITGLSPRLSGSSFWGEETFRKNRLATFSRQNEYLRQSQNRGKRATTDASFRHAKSACVRRAEENCESLQWLKASRASLCTSSQPMRLNRTAVGQARRWRRSVGR